MAVKRKLSIDLTSKNREKIEEIKNTYGLSYGDTINTVLNAVLSMSPETSARLLDILKSEMRSINTKLKVSGEYGNEKLNQQLKEYDNLAKCFNGWQFVSPDDLKPFEKMQEIRIKNGTLICPSDWILINPEEAAESEYAGVVECNNSVIYKTPHFVWLRKDPSVNNFSPEEEEKVKKMCVAKWPPFEDIIQKQVSLEPDPDNLGSYTNLDDWMKSPAIGYFTIIPDDSPLYEADKEPPFGAKIKRDKR